MATNSAPVPHEEWTDDEWLRVLQTFDPSTDVADAERKVGEWRDLPTV